MACTVLGDGSRGGYSGVAPEAQLIFQAMERDSDGQFLSPSLNYIMNQAYSNGARIHTNFWVHHLLLTLVSILHNQRMLI